MSRVLYFFLITTKIHLDKSSYFFIISIRYLLDGSGTVMNLYHIRIKIQNKKDYELCILFFSKSFS